MTFPAPNFALAMSPLDWGIHIGAVVMVVFAARTVFTGKGKSQIGFSFAVLASILWTLALGRHIDGFSIVDGLCVGIGALLMVPTLRVLFSHTGGSVSTAVVSGILAALLAGPVVGRYVSAVTTDTSPALVQLERDLASVEADLEKKIATRDSVASFAASERAKLEDLGIESADAVESDPEALKVLEVYAGYRTELNRLTADIAGLRDHKVELESAIESANRGLDSGAAESVDAMTEAERIRKRVRDAAESEKSALETYTERGKMLDLFEREFGEDADQAD